jgi:hypothetical protein
VINGKPNAVTRPALFSITSTVIRRVHLDTDKIKLLLNLSERISKQWGRLTVYPSFDEQGPDKCINFLPPNLRSLLE